LVSFSLACIPRDVASDDAVAVVDQTSGEARNGQIPSGHERVMPLHEVEHHLQGPVDGADPVRSTGRCGQLVTEPFEEITGGPLGDQSARVGGWCLGERAGRRSS
jgi:hypothetical protein